MTKFEVWDGPNGQIRIDPPGITLSALEAKELYLALKVRCEEKMRYQRWTLERDDMVRKMYAEGRKTYEIAAALGTTVFSVATRITKLGIADRDPKRAAMMRAKKEES